MKKFAVLIAAVMMITVGSSLAAATTPEFNENQDTDAFVDNTSPVILGGWIIILDQDGVVVYNSSDPTAFTRSDSYVWESEKLVVYAIIHDDNGESDLWQHTAQAWLSPEGILITDLAIAYFTNSEETTAVFKGEKLIPDPLTWQCTHDVYITDVDKYGACATNDGLEIFYPLYINPEMSSTFEGSDGLDFVLWSYLLAGDEDVPADGNAYMDHVLAQCFNSSSGDYDDVLVDYLLKIHGTDLEGGIGVSHVIPCENVEYSFDGGPWTSLTNGEVELGTFVTCTPHLFDFRITVPYIEMGNYAGEVGFGIKAL